MAECCSSTGLATISERSRLASSLLLQAQKLRIEKNVRGVQRVEKKIKSEQTFLESILSGQTALRDTHLSSNNLTHIQSVLLIARETEELVAVQQCFTLVPSLGVTPVSVQVDVVGEGGGRWVRVVCRKRTALHHRWLGDGQFGEKSVADIAAEYMEAGRHNLHRFKPPNISFVFFDGITESIARVLAGRGIQVVGPVYADDSTEDPPSLAHVTSLFRESIRGGLGVRDSGSVELLAKPQSTISTECERVNLDVSTMLAWVSSLTHGGQIYAFEERILNEQAEQEQQSHLWPQLQAATKGKHLMACRSAVDGFRSIVNTIGGEQEKARAKSLLDVLEVVEDCPSARAMALTLSHRVKHRAKVVFGSGDTLCATTITANEGFVRAATHQGVNFETFTHSSRALTEAKQVLIADIELVGTTLNPDSKAPSIHPLVNDSASPAK